MTFRPLRKLAWLAVFVFLFSVRPAAATIDYHVSLKDPEQHIFHVTMKVPVPVHQKEIVVAIPAWNALYQIRDFSSQIQQVEVRQGPAQPGSHAATDGSTPSIEKIDKQTWHISGNGTVVVRYAIYWDETGPFATQLNREHAFINPAMILMYVPERRSEQVHFGLDDIPQDWMGEGPGIQQDEQMGRARQFSSTFPNYDALADAQHAGAPTLNFGLFINAIINFLIVGFAIFWVVKGLTRLHLREEAKTGPKTEDLLVEIRDLLKAQAAPHPPQN